MHSVPLPMSWPRESWPWYRSLSFLVGLIVLTIVVTLAAVAAGAALHAIRQPIGRPENAPFLLIVQLVTYVPILGGMLYALPWTARRPLSALGFRLPGAREIGIGVGGAVAMFVVVQSVGAFVAQHGFKSPEQAVELFKHLTATKDRILFFAVAAVGAPLAEELTFRVFGFGAIRRYVPTGVAAVLSAVLFGFAHISPSGPADLVPQLVAVALPLACGGVVLAYVYVASNCYWSNVITHATFNAASVIAIFFFHAT